MTRRRSMRFRRCACQKLLDVAHAGAEMCKTQGFCNMVQANPQASICLSSYLALELLYMKCGA